MAAEAMDGRIERLSCHYRAVGDPMAARALAARLHRVAEGELGGALDRSLEEALGDAPVVYVLRRVAVRLALDGGTARSDGEIAKRWAAELAGGLVRTLAGQPGSGELMRFENQAEYVARFAADLVAGRAYRHWYYAPFGRYQRLPRGRAIAALLLDHRADLPAVLAHLQKRGALERLLSALDPAAREELWERGLDRLAAAAGEGLRPLLAAAVSLADRLDLWAGARPDLEHLLQAFASKHLAPADWMDRRSLAQAVLGILHRLEARGELRWPPGGLGDRRAKHRRALADLDWLDADWLLGALVETAGGTPAARDALALPTEEGPAETPPDVSATSGGEAAETLPALPARPPAGGLTPRQRELLADLDSALGASGGPALDRRDPGAAANALRLYALLVARAPRWGGDPLAPTLIARLVQAWELLSGSGDGMRVLSLLEGGDRGAALEALRPADRPRTAPALDFLAAAGKVGRRLVALLLGDAAGPESMAAAPGERSGPGPAPEVPAALTVLLSSRRVELDRRRPDAPANALRLRTALADLDPSWAADPGAEATFQALLSAWAWLARLPGPAVALAALERGDLEGAVEGFDEADRPGAARALGALASRGPACLRPLRLLVEEPPPDAGPPGGAPVPGEATASACAGLFLLLRAVGDARLPGLLDGAGYPPRGIPSRAGAALAALGLRWAGAAGSRAGRLDPGLALFAGLQGTPGLDELRAVWSPVAPEDHRRFQAALLDALAGQRLLTGSTLRIHRLPRSVAGRPALVAGCSEPGLWPLGRVLAPGAKPGEVFGGWLAAWEQATGGRPETVTCDASLAAGLRAAGLDAMAVRVADGNVASELDGDPVGEIREAHRESRGRLLGALRHLDAGRLGLPEADLTLGLTAVALLRLWARWLRGFSASTVPYLLDRLIRRGGRIVDAGEVREVRLDPAPLDPVLQMSGYTADLQRPGEPTVRWTFTGVP